MAAINIPYQLTTVAGTILFNDFNSDGGDGYYHLTNIDGLELGDVRGEAVALSRRDGAYIPPSFEGPKTITIEGQLVHTGFRGRDRLERDLVRLCRAMMKVEGQLIWYDESMDPPVWKTITMRIAAKPTISNDNPKSFQTQFLAADPRIYSQTVVAQDTDFLSPTGGAGLEFPVKMPFAFGGLTSGGEATFTTEGDAETFPVVRIWGPIKNPRIKNKTTGDQVALTRGLQLAPLDYAEVNMLDETVIRGSDGTNLMRFFNPLTSAFWPLMPGDNDVRLFGQNPDITKTRATVIWQDAWT